MAYVDKSIRLTIPCSDTSCPGQIVLAFESAEEPLEGAFAQAEKLGWAIERDPPFVARCVVHADKREGTTAPAQPTITTRELQVQKPPPMMTRRIMPTCYTPPYKQWLPGDPVPPPFDAENLDGAVLHIWYQGSPESKHSLPFAVQVLYDALPFNGTDFGEMKIEHRHLVGWTLNGRFGASVAHGYGREIENDRWSVAQVNMLCASTLSMTRIRALGRTPEVMWPSREMRANAQKLVLRRDDLAGMTLVVVSEIDGTYRFDWDMVSRTFVLAGAPGDVDLITGPFSWSLKHHWVFPAEAVIAGECNDAITGVVSETQFNRWWFRSVEARDPQLASKHRKDFDVSDEPTAATPAAPAQPTAEPAASIFRHGLYAPPYMRMPGDPLPAPFTAESLAGTLLNLWSDEGGGKVQKSTRMFNGTDFGPMGGERYLVGWEVVAFGDKPTTLAFGYGQIVSLSPTWTIDELNVMRLMTLAANKITPDAPGVWPEHVLRRAKASESLALIDWQLGGMELVIEKQIDFTDDGHGYRERSILSWSSSARAFVRPPATPIRGPFRWRLQHKYIFPDRHHIIGGECTDSTTVAGSVSEETFNVWWYRAVHAYDPTLAVNRRKDFISLAALSVMSRDLSGLPPRSVAPLAPSADKEPPFVRPQELLQTGRTEEAEKLAAAEGPKENFSQLNEAPETDRLERADLRRDPVHERFRLLCTGRRQEAEKLASASDTKENETRKKLLDEAENKLPEPVEATLSALRFTKRRRSAYNQGTELMLLEEARAWALRKLAQAGNPGGPAERSAVLCDAVLAGAAGMADVAVTVDADLLVALASGIIDALDNPPEDDDDEPVTAAEISRREQDESIGQQKDGPSPASVVPGPEYQENVVQVQVPVLHEPPGAGSISSGLTGSLRILRGGSGADEGLVKLSCKDAVVVVDPNDLFDAVRRVQQHRGKSRAMVVVTSIVAPRHQVELHTFDEKYLRVVLLRTTPGGGRGLVDAYVVTQDLYDAVVTCGDED